MVSTSYAPLREEVAPLGPFSCFFAYPIPFCSPFYLRYAPLVHFVYQMITVIYWFREYMLSLIWGGAEQGGRENVVVYQQVLFIALVHGSTLLYSECDDLNFKHLRMQSCICKLALQLQCLLYPYTWHSLIPWLPNQTHSCPCISQISTSWCYCIAWNAYYRSSTDSPKTSLDRMGLPCNLYSPLQGRLGPYGKKCPCLILLQSDRQGRYIFILYMQPLVVFLF